MVALKSSEFDSFLDRGKQPIVLIFGPDAGLVRERAQALIARAVEDLNDPFSLARLDGDTLAETPERLVEEAHTIPLFGGRRAVLVRAGTRNFSAAVE
jgi:DNA polymerase-3 subunit delta